MGTGENLATDSTRMNSTKRQLSPDERSVPPPDISHLYESGESAPLPQSLALSDWPARTERPFVEEPVWMLPYYHEPAIMGYRHPYSSPANSLTLLYDDRNSKRRIGEYDDEEPPTSCMRASLVFLGGFVILAIALAAVVAIVYTQNHW